MKDAGRIGFIIKGEYSDTETYDFLDVVYYNGSSYVAKKETLGNEPTESGEFWQILAVKGESASAVTGVKGSAESEYREGDVNITPANLGIKNATDTKAGLVKPDGKSIKVEADGTITAIFGFVGTKTEAETALAAGQLADGMLVYITND